MWKDRVKNLDQPPYQIIHHQIVPNLQNSPKKTNDNGPQANDKMRFIVAAGYQMGPYDGLKLTLDNPLSKYVKLNDVSLATKEDMCVYQGIDVPLDCDKTLYSGMGPSHYWCSR